MAKLYLMEFNTLPKKKRFSSVLTFEQSSKGFYFFELGMCKLYVFYEQYASD